MGEGVGLAVVGVGLGVVVVGGGDSVGGKDAVGGSVGSTFVITQRCRPPRSLRVKNTVLMEQSLAALKNLLQFLPARSFKTIR